MAVYGARVSALDDCEEFCNAFEIIRELRRRKKKKRRERRKRGRRRRKKKRRRKRRRRKRRTNTKFILKILYTHTHPLLHRHRTQGSQDAGGVRVSAGEAAVAAVPQKPR